MYSKNTVESIATIYLTAARFIVVLVSLVASPEEISLPSKLTRKQRAWILAIGILTLLVGLYAGALQYRNSTNTAACIINQSSLTKAAQATEGITNSTPTSFSDIVGPTKMLSQMPTCPGGGTYTLTYSSTHYHNAVKCSCKGH